MTKGIINRFSTMPVAHLLFRAAMLFRLYYPIFFGRAGDDSRFGQFSI
jgi:hypothetical protein